MSKLVMIGKSWCGYCKKAKSELEPFTGNKNLKIVMDEEADKYVSQHNLSVSGYPTFVIEKNGQALKESLFSGFGGLETLKQKANEHNVELFRENFRGPLRRENFRGPLRRENFRGPLRRENFCVPVAPRRENFCVPVAPRRENFCVPVAPRRENFCVPVRKPVRRENFCVPVKKLAPRRENYSCSSRR
jgi:glutaredoxin